MISKARVRNPHRRLVCCVSCGRDTRDYLCLCENCRPHDDPVDDMVHIQNSRGIIFAQGAGIGALHEWDDWINRSPVLQGHVTLECRERPRGDMILRLL